MKPTLRYSLVLGDLVLLVHSRDRPRDDEWDAYCEFLASKNPSHVRCLVVSQGGGPNGRQRKQLQEVSGAAQPRVAIITPSALVRAIAAVLSWHYVHIRSFGPSNIDAALEFLDIEPADRLVVHTAVAAMQAELTSGVAHKNAS